MAIRPAAAPKPTMKRLLSPVNRASAAAAKAIIQQNQSFKALLVSFSMAHKIMGTTAARKLKVIVGNLYSVLSFELMAAVQGIELRGEQEALSPVHEALFQLVRRDVPFMAEDHELRVDITAMNALMRSGEIPALVHRFLPEL